MMQTNRHCCKILFYMRDLSNGSCSSDSPCLSLPSTLIGLACTTFSRYSQQQLRRLSLIPSGPLLAIIPREGALPYTGPTEPHPLEICSSTSEGILLHFFRWWEVLLLNGNIFLMLVFFCFVFLLFWDTVSLLSLDCPGTHYIVQAGLKLRFTFCDSLVLGLKAWAIIPALTFLSS